MAKLSKGSKGGNTSFSKFRRLGQAEANKFAVTTANEEKFQYRNREDISTLPPNIMVVGSQNVLTNTSGRVALRKGYTLDGQASTTIAGIRSAFDYEMNQGTIQHLRSGYLTTAGNDGKLQFRYKNSAGVVVWTDLLTGLNSTNFTFCPFGIFNSGIFQQSLCLFVNGGLNIWEWTGGMGTFASGSNASGFIASYDVAPTAGGTGYVVGDVLTLEAGIGGTATLEVVGTGSSGAVTAVTLLTNASGYSTGTGKVTTGGSGTSCTIHIVSVANGAIFIQNQTIQQAGFYQSGNHNVSINSVTYAYTAVAGNAMVGVSPDPTLAGAVGDLVFQLPESTNNSTIAQGSSSAKLPVVNWTNDLIASLDGFVYLGSFISNQVFVSKNETYKDFGYTSGTILPADGTVLMLDAPTTALISQDQQMYLSAGRDFWWTFQINVTVDASGTSLRQDTLNRLKTGALQGTQSQALTTKIANYVIYVSNEPILEQLGLVPNNIAWPQLNDISSSIVNDMNSYDFTGGNLVYHKKFFYLSIPTQGIVRVYNMTDTSTDNAGKATNHYWEAPQTLPVGCFSIIDGELYGHDYNVPQTYKLFNGTNDNGNFISANVTFPFINHGMRPAYKNFNLFYAEGYISSNTTLNLNLLYLMNGSPQTYKISGTDTRILSSNSNNNSLGKFSLGKQPLGGDLIQQSSLPPKFRVIKSPPISNYFEYQASFSSYGKDFIWELLAYGPAIQTASELPVSITQ